MKTDDGSVQRPPGDGGGIKEDKNDPRKGQLIEQAETRTEQANLRTDQANTRTEEANIRTDQANTRTEKANTRTEQAELRTEKVETQIKAIRVSEVSYRRLFEAARDGILILDFDTGCVADVNPFLVELLGFSHDEMVGKTVGELSPFRDIVANQGVLERLQKDGYVRYDDLPLETKDGRLIAVEFVSNVYQADGQTVIQCNIRDITAHKAAAGEIRWKTAFFEAQVESSPDGILVVDQQGKKILQNHRMRSLWKTPPQIDANTDDSVQLEYVTKRTKNPREFAAKVAYLYAHPDEESQDVIELIDGTILDRHSSPVCSKAGKYYGRIWIFRDITEQRKLEAQSRQSQKMESIGQLAGGIAHDFNNILTVIMMQADLARTVENTPGEVRESLAGIDSAAKRAANLTRQLLLFSQQQVMQPRQLDLNEIVTSLVKLLRRLVREDVSLQLHLHSKPLLTYADEGMLDQVLMNLTINARDAMPKGGQLTIETSEKTIDAEQAARIPEASPGRYVWFCVSDTGCGISPEVLPHIFEPFFTTKEVGKGTGLGLATVFGIVKQHRGWPVVNSETGKGTTFQVFLPASETSAEARAKVTAKPSPRGGSETILVVEDDNSVRLLTRVLLERHGYHVLEAADGVEATRVWTEHQSQIALLLTDLVMPGGMDGRELAACLQTQRPGLGVIFNSGYSASFAGRELALKAGQNFLQKPCLPDLLLETVRKCLDR